MVCLENTVCHSLSMFGQWVEHQLNGIIVPSFHSAGALPIDPNIDGYIPLFRHPLFRHPLFRHLCLLCILAKYMHYNISFINRALISNRFPTCPSSRSCWNDWLASKQLLRYLKDNDLLPDLQSAYRGHQ